MTLSFSNKRPISIAIDISAVTRYARLMDPRLSLRRTPCCPVPFTNPYPPFYLPSDGRSWPLLDDSPTPLATKHPPLFFAAPFSLSLCSFTFTCSSLSRLANFALDSISLSLFDLIKENTRNARYTHTLDTMIASSIAFESSILSHDCETWHGLDDCLRGFVRGDSSKLFVFDRGNGGLLWIRRRKDVR